MYIDEGTYLRHYGVKGMKWGIRKERERVYKTQNSQQSSDRNKKVSRAVRKKQKAYDRNVRRNWYKAYNKAAEISERTLIPQINKKYSPKDLEDPVIREKYYAEYNRKFEQLYKTEYKKMFGERPR